ncbi:MAG: DUF86 domain-containing protein [Sediminibacterium sp.]
MDDILDAALAIKLHTNGITSYEKFIGNRLVYRAVERELEIIGEALVKIRNEKYELNIDNQNKIIGLRNRIVHDYGNTNYEIIWGIVYLHLDNLIVEIEQEIKKLLDHKD